MRNYEVVVIIHPELEQAVIDSFLEKLKGWITGSGGTINSVDVWGKRKMAYLIRKQREGYYVLLKTEMPPASCSELERNLRLTESLLRFAIISAKE